ncbi:MAG: putative DNA binding domain-containing protein [Bacteroidetes bacterium]|nr:putative DNA binding domain-containing protein [Bacteroidota bacterium]
MNHSAQELFDLLNERDECPWIEAKGGGESSHAVMESVCAFCNEPGLGGGYILMGVAQDVTALFPQYKISGVQYPDKFQRDLATQCATMFNSPVRPRVEVEKIAGKIVVKVWIDELPQRQKPVYFKTEGLPSGAFRRIGSTDQHCTEDDMHVFYQGSESYDQTPVTGAFIEDIDEAAIKRYRTLREKVNPSAEELLYTDIDLLKALGCLNKQKPNELNLAGLLLFGNSKIQRSTFPMLRVDYIRVPGNVWVENPDNRFTTIDMRGSAILMLFRLIDAINADLPKGFLLQDGNIQASTVGLPMKALREAIVNALMHRSYREHRPTQIIRYDNRIEIINPGYSLKSEEQLGNPGSETRNPFIAAIFHETNLAETKGSGIRAMRKLMQEAHLAPPTFESSRETNEFVSRLLLHHFLDDADLEWLKRFDRFELSDTQKQALIFVREVGAIDNHTYRQMSDCDTLKASNDLRAMKTLDLFLSKGKGKATYYIASKFFSTEGNALSTEVDDALSTEANVLSTEGDNLSTEANVLSTEGDVNPKDSNTLGGRSTIVDRNALLSELPDSLRESISSLNKRERDLGKIIDLIIEICRIRPFQLMELSSILQKGDNYVSRKFLRPMIEKGELKFFHPEMISHPEQAYCATESED